LKIDFSYEYDFAKERGDEILQNSPPAPLLSGVQSYEYDFAKERGEGIFLSTHCSCCFAPDPCVFEVKFLIKTKCGKEREEKCRGRGQNS